MKSCVFIRGGVQLHYNFYFDESFHDRAITLSSEGILNVLDESKNDSYIGVFWGCKNTESSRALRLLSQFEMRQRKNFGLPNDKELKSTNISKNHFEVGLRSFNKNTLVFYTDLFQTIKTLKPIIQIEAISKVEYYLRCLLNNTEFPYWVDSKAFFYSLTKFFIVYHNSQLLQALYSVVDSESAAKFKDLLLEQISILLDAIKGIPRKSKEESAYREIYMILASLDIELKDGKHCDFDYSPNFNGLINLLTEIDIPFQKVNLAIDQEEKTYQTALRYSFNSVKQQKSHNSVYIRLSDWISGFIGRMMFALSNDCGMQEDKVDHFEDIKKNDLTSKRILSSKWFDIDKDRFDLYHLIYDTLLVQQEHYWTTMTMSYCDQVVMFYTLIRYFAGYHSYADYCRVESKMHSEYYNASCCNELMRCYGESQ